MYKKKILKIFFIIFLLTAISLFIYSKFFYDTKTIQLKTEVTEDVLYKSNIIENVLYTTRDVEGNEYTISARQGEIDFSNSNIIYLTKVKALIKLINSNDIKITSNYGKYNLNNFNTLFSQNVIINYLDNKITAEYLDFSLEKNLMIISRNVIYTNLENILKADVIEVDIKTKDTKIFMHEEEEKVNIKSKE